MDRMDAGENGKDPSMSPTTSIPLAWPPPGHAYDGPVNVASIRRDPPTTSRRDSSSQHDKDKTRRLSCKECRRLKLRCDRVFPCQSCVKRGCADICPDGSLTSGPGSRFILANTTKLHEKISQLSERVRELEDALGTFQTYHPLLTPELLQIKLSEDLHSHSKSSPPPTSLHPSTSHSNGNLHDSVEAMSILEPVRQPPYRFERAPLTDPTKPFISDPPVVNSDILQLSATFPFPWAVDLSIRERIRNALPPRHEALQVCQSARTNALWQYNLDASTTFVDNLLRHCYESAVEDLGPRRLSLLLMILSIGSLTDLNRKHGTLHGEAYHHLARAAVCEIPLMEEPDFDVLHTLFYMLWFHLSFSDNNKAVGYAWNLMGFVAKLAQGLGLHRDGARTKMMLPEDDDRRRLVFWELLNLDCRMSLSLGRPPSLNLAHVDIRPSTYDASGLFVTKEEVIYHQWKNKFFIECLSPILENMVNVSPPGYSRALELDAMVREFEVPGMFTTKHSDSSPGLSKARFLAMQSGLVTTSMDIALLQLHRRYFTEAMNGPGPFDLHHKYAPSVVATYLSASSLISSVELLYAKEPQLTIRFLSFWFNSFSAAVTLSLFIARAPSNSLSPFALQDLDRVCVLFRRAAPFLPFSGKALPVVEKLVERCRRAYEGWKRISAHSHPGPSNTIVVLPESFDFAHERLCAYVEQIQVTPPVPSLVMVTNQNGETEGDEVYLPNIYSFSTNGIGINERYRVATAPATPFVPSTPRVDGKESFNFDHGEIMAQVEETSYMAWF